MTKKKVIKITSKNKQKKVPKTPTVKKGSKTVKNSKNSVKTWSNAKKPKKEEVTGRAKGYSNLIPGANKNGRPKGVLNFTTRLEIGLRILAEKYVEDNNKKYKQKSKHIKVDDVDIMGDIFLQYINKARTGDLKAMDSIFDRAYGKATQRLEHTGENGNPIEIELRKKEAKSKARKMLDRYLK